MTNSSGSESFFGSGASFFPLETIYLAPSDAAYFQIRENFLEGLDYRSGAAVLMMPRLYTFSSFEALLGQDILPPEVESLQRDFILSGLAAELPAALKLFDPDSTAFNQKITQEMASDLGDGFDRLKLAGIGWSELKNIRPYNFSSLVASLGEKYDQCLQHLNVSDRFSKRRKILDLLNSGHHFNALKGIKQIICLPAERFSPFESSLISALMQHYKMSISFNIPSWVRNEDLSHGSGFDIVRVIREIEKSADGGPDALIEFCDAPPAENAALRYAAENILAPVTYRSTAPCACDSIKILAVPSPYHEVEEAARRLKDLAFDEKAGPLHRFAILVPDINKYSDLIKDVGRRFGIPFHLGHEEALMDQMPIRSIMDLLDLCSSHWELSAVMRLLSSPYFKFKIDPIKLRLLALECGVTDDRAGGGFEKNLLKSRHPEAKQLLSIVKKLKKQAELLKKSSSWSDMLENFRIILNELSWPGYLNDNLEVPANIREKEIKSAFAFKDELVQLQQALESDYTPPLSLNNFRFWLRYCLSHRHLKQDANPHGRVWVINYYDCNGAQFDEIFCLGLNEGVFPQTGPDKHWWPEEFIQALSGSALGRSLWRTSADRYRQEEGMVASVLGQARKKAWLIYSHVDSSMRPLLASPLIEHLKELWDMSPENERPTEEKITWPTPVKLDRVRAYDELGPSLMRIPKENWPLNLPNNIISLRHDLEKRQQQWMMQKISVNAGPAAMAKWFNRIKSYNGYSLWKAQFFSNFYSCPLSFWLKDVLNLELDAKTVEEWPSTDEGTLAHKALEKFLQPFLGRPWPDKNLSATELQNTLLKIIDDLCERCESVNPLGREPLWPQRRDNLTAALLTWLDRELAQREQTVPISLEWTFDDKDDAQAKPLKISGLESDFYLKGRIDRIDEFIDNGQKKILVRDYKLRPSGFYKMSRRSGKIPAPLFPLHIYALAAAAHFSMETHCALEFLNSPTGYDQQAGYRTNENALSLDAETRIDMRNNNLFNLANSLTDIFQAIRTGVFSDIWDEEEADCEYCDYKLICPKMDLSSGSGEN